MAQSVNITNVGERAKIKGIIEEQLIEEQRVDPQKMGPYQRNSQGIGQLIVLP